MRNWLLWSVASLFFLSLNIRAEVPYATLAARACVVPCEGIDDPRERTASQSTKPSTLLQIPISAVSLKTEGGWFSPGDSNLYLEEQGENRYVSRSLLPLIPASDGSFVVQDKIFNGMPSPNVGDGTYNPGRIIGKIVHHGTPEAQFSSLNGKLRFPFPHQLADVMSAINFDEKTLAVADSVNKVLTLSLNGKAPSISMPFPNKDWNVVRVTPVGAKSWLILFTDAPLFEEPRIPEFGKLPPPPPVRRYNAYIATEKGFQPRPIKSWEGALLEFSLVSTKKAAAIRVIQLGQPTSGGLQDLATTENIYWVRSDSTIHEVSSQRINHWDTRHIYGSKNYVVFLFQDPETAETTVWWWSSEGDKRQSTFPTPKAGLFGRNGPHNWSVLNDGSILYDCLPNAKVSGPAAFTNEDPAPVHADPRSFPRHMFILRPDGDPIGIRLDPAPVKKGEVVPENPWNYSFFAAEDHLWVLSSEIQKEKMYVGQIPLGAILSAK